MTAQTNVTALLAVLNGALPGPKVQAYELDKVPDPRPRCGVEVSLSRRYGGVPRVTSRIATTGYRFTLRGVSLISIEDVRQALQTCKDAVEYQRLTVDGQTSTPIQFETEDFPEPDANGFSGAMAFTYAIKD